MKFIFNRNFKYLLANLILSLTFVFFTNCRPNRLASIEESKETSSISIFCSQDETLTSFTCSSELSGSGVNNLNWYSNKNGSTFLAEPKLNASIEKCQGKATCQFTGVQNITKYVIVVSGVSNATNRVIFSSKVPVNQVVTPDKLVVNISCSETQITKGDSVACKITNQTEASSATVWEFQMDNGTFSEIQECKGLLHCKIKANFNQGAANFRATYKSIVSNLANVVIKNPPAPDDKKTMELSFDCNKSTSLNVNQYDKVECTIVKGWDNSLSNWQSYIMFNFRLNSTGVTVPINTTIVNKTFSFIVNVPTGDYDIVLTSVSQSVVMISSKSTVRINVADHKTLAIDCGTDMSFTSENITCKLTSNSAISNPVLILKIDDSVASGSDLSSCRAGTSANERTCTIATKTKGVYGVQYTDNDGSIRSDVKTVRVVDDGSVTCTFANDVSTCTLTKNNKNLFNKSWELAARGITNTTFQTINDCAIVDKCVINKLPSGNYYVRATNRTPTNTTVYSNNAELNVGVAPIDNTVVTKEIGTILKGGQILETQNLLLKMAENGNLAISKKSDQSMLWSSNSGGYPTGKFSFRLESDGNLAIYQEADLGPGKVIWSAKYSSPVYAYRPTKDEKMSLEFKETAPYLRIIGGNGREYWNSKNANPPRQPTPFKLSCNKGTIHVGDKVVCKLETKNTYVPRGLQLYLNGTVLDADTASCDNDTRECTWIKATQGKSNLMVKDINAVDKSELVSTNEVDIDVVAVKDVAPPPTTPTGQLVDIPMGKTLKEGESISNNSVKLVLESDGNLVIRKTNGELLQSFNIGGFKSGRTYLTFQNDGNLTINQKFADKSSKFHFATFCNNFPDAGCPQASNQGSNFKLSLSEIKPYLKIVDGSGLTKWHSDYQQSVPSSFSVTCSNQSDTTWTVGSKAKCVLNSDVYYSFRNLKVSVNGVSLGTDKYSCVQKFPDAPSCTFTIEQTKADTNTVKLADFDFAEKQMILTNGKKVEATASINLNNVSPGKSFITPPKLVITPTFTQEGYMNANVSCTAGDSGGQTRMGYIFVGWQNPANGAEWFFYKKGVHSPIKFTIGSSAVPQDYYGKSIDLAAIPTNTNCETLTTELSTRLNLFSWAPGGVLYTGYGVGSTAAEAFKDLTDNLNKGYVSNGLFVPVNLYLLGSGSDYMLSVLPNEGGYKVTVSAIKLFVNKPNDGKKYKKITRCFCNTENCLGHHVIKMDDQFELNSGCQKEGAPYFVLDQEACTGQNESKSKDPNSLFVPLYRKYNPSEPNNFKYGNYAQLQVGGSVDSSWQVLGCVYR